MVGQLSMIQVAYICGWHHCCLPPSFWAIIPVGDSVLCLLIIICPLMTVCVTACSSSSPLQEAAARARERAAGLLADSEFIEGGEAEAAAALVEQHKDPGAAEKVGAVLYV